MSLQAMSKYCLVNRESETSCLKPHVHLLFYPFWHLLMNVDRNTSKGAPHAGQWGRGCVFVLGERVACWRYRRVPGVDNLPGRASHTRAGMSINHACIEYIYVFIQHDVEDGVFTCPAPSIAQQAEAHPFNENPPGKPTTERVWCH